MDTAAVIRSLDLVITSDSAVAHLAGALAAPVWVALGRSCDWRWLDNREDSPWYPTMRLFRQERLNDWEGLFARIAAELADVVVQPSRLLFRAGGTPAPLLRQATQGAPRLHRFLWQAGRLHHGGRSPWRPPFRLANSLIGSRSWKSNGSG